MCARSGGKRLKWVGPSIGPARKPSFSAIESSWMETWPPYSCSASICLGALSGPCRISGVSKLMAAASGLGAAATLARQHRQDEVRLRLRVGLAVVRRVRLAQRRSGAHSNVQTPAALIELPEGNVSGHRHLV